MYSWPLEEAEKVGNHEGEKTLIYLDNILILILPLPADLFFLCKILNQWETGEGVREREKGGEEWNIDTIVFDKRNDHYFTYRGEGAKETFDASAKKKLSDFSFSAVFFELNSKAIDWAVAE